MLGNRENFADKIENDGAEEHKRRDHEAQFPVSLSGTQPRVNRLDGLSQLVAVSRVVDDDGRSSALVGQRHLSADSLPSRRHVPAVTIAQPLALYLVGAATCCSNVSVTWRPQLLFKSIKEVVTELVDKATK